MVEIKVLDILDDPIAYVATGIGDDPASRLIVFPTARNIRHFYGALSMMMKGKAVVSPYCVEVNEFIKQCLDAGGKALVANNLRPLYLRKAISRLENTRLEEIFKGGSRRVCNDFVEFAATGSRILRFFDEIYAEKVTAEMLTRATLYTDYEKHIEILKELAESYRDALAEDGLIDPMFLKMEGRIHAQRLEGIDKIYFLVGGYLTGFELELLRDIAEKKELEIILRYEGGPDRQVEKIFTAFGKEGPVLGKAALPSVVEIRAFEVVAEQFGLIMHAVEKALKAGIPPEEIAVILPDENTKRILRGLDRERVFNYAMGLDFKDTVFFSFLKSIDSLFRERVDHDHYRTERVITFIGHPFITNLGGKPDFTDEFVHTVKEKNRLILKADDFCTSDELRNLFSRVKALLTDQTGYGDFLLSTAELIETLMPVLDKDFVDAITRSPEFREAKNVFMDFLYQSASLPYDGVYKDRDPLGHMRYLMEQLGRLSYSDVAGGFITVMGMLETRNLRFRAVVIPDMNEGIMPARNEKEMFLNTSVREMMGIPTYHDRENLVGHYFVGLVKNADMVFLSYVERDDRSVRSRFIEEILIETGHTGEDPSWLRQGGRYKELVFNSTSRPVSHATPDVISKDKSVLKILEGMTFTPYALSAYRRCSYNFYLRYVRGVSEPSELRDELIPMDMGTLLHRALKNVYREKKSFADAGELYRRMREEVRGEAERGYDIFRVSPQARFELDVILDKLYRFAESETERIKKGWIPGFLEYTIAFSLGSRKFAGRIDRVDVKDGEGGKKTAFIIDYKFSNIKGLKHFRYDGSFSEFQLPLYRLMFENRHPEYEIEGFGFYDLKDRLEMVAVAEHDTPEVFVDLLREVTDEIVSPAGTFVKTEDTGLCMRCGFKRICGRLK